MKTEIKTVFDTVTTQVPRDVVAMEVPVQVAHLLMNLVGYCTPRIDTNHGAAPADVRQFFDSLWRTLGKPSQSAYPRLRIEERQPGDLF